MLRPFALLRVVGSFCATIETSEIQFSHVQTDATTPNNVASACTALLKMVLCFFLAFEVGEQVVNWQRTSAWCLLR